jgi:hypothetical protein
MNTSTNVFRLLVTVCYSTPYLSCGPDENQYSLKFNLPYIRETKYMSQIVNLNKIHKIPGTNHTTDELEKLHIGEK